MHHPPIAYIIIFSGVPSCQRTVPLEKASVLFNMGALYTQIGAKQDRSSTKGLDAAVDSFLRAAGTFRYINENFTNAPSMDLGPEMLEMFVELMLVSVFSALSAINIERNPATFRAKCSVFSSNLQLFCMQLHVKITL